MVIALLAGLQLVVAWSLSRKPAARAVATSGPTMLVRDDVLLDETLLQQRMTAAEVRQAVRVIGRGSLDDVAAVVPESDGIGPRGQASMRPTLIA
jgi:uncharacterized membrane protein YcaP (DUF421 family)